MARKIIGAFCILMAVGGAVGASTQHGPDAAASCVIAALFAVIGLVLLLKKGKSKAEKTAVKKQKQELKEQRSRMLTAQHMAGLPLAEGVVCVLSFDDDCVTVTSGGSNFRVALEKVTDLEVKTSTEIQKSYVSSIGGAVGGAVLFGPLGAMVGGRAKEKTSKTIDNYFIITYAKDNSVDYLSFLLSSNDGLKAFKIIERYKPLLSCKPATIDL